MESFEISSFGGILFVFSNKSLQKSLKQFNFAKNLNLKSKQ